MTGPDTGGGASAAPHRDRLLIDLGQELRAMRNELGEATGRFDLVVRDVSEVIGPDVATLRTEMAELRGAVDALLEEPGGATEEAVLHWPDLSVQDAEEAWDALATWVHTTLGYWYEISRAQLPDCWPVHRPALLQVWWLRLTYLTAHEGAGAAPVSMAEWNTRWLDAALGRIAVAIPDTMCRAVAGGPGQHLVPKHEAERRAAPVAPGESGVRGSEPREALARVQARVEARRAAPAGSPSPYSIPGFAAAVATSTGTAGEKPEAAWTGTSADQEVTGPRYWGEFLAQAREADLRWRRERDAAALTVTTGA